MVKRLIAILICIKLVACNGHLEIEKNDLPQGYADSQVAGIWKITAFTSDFPIDWNGDGSTETNLYNVWTPCQKDNLYQFSGDKTGLFKLNCNSSVPGNWQIINTLHLVYTPSGQVPESEKIISMTSVVFKTTQSITGTTGQNYLLTKTWTRQ
jgi:hypothetical protein